MIVEALVKTFNSVLNAVLYIIPNVPAIPTEITSAVEQINTNIVSGVGLLAYILSSELLIAGIGIITLALTYRYLYKLVMWLLLKLPVAIQ